jgi:hypothetical protein
VAAFAAERRELVDDDQAGSGSSCGDTHQVEQQPGANLRGQRRVGCGVEAEEHDSVVADGVLQGHAGSEVLPGDSLDDEAEPSPEAGDALALELAESVDLTGQSSRLRHAKLAQRGQQLVGIEEVEYELGCPLEAGQVDRLDQPQQIALRCGAVDVCVARIPLTLNQTVGHTGGITAQWVPAQRSVDAPDGVVGHGGDLVVQAGRGFAIHHDDG